MRPTARLGVLLLVAGCMPAQAPGDKDSSRAREVISVSARTLTPLGFHRAGSAVQVLPKGGTWASGVIAPPGSSGYGQAPPQGAGPKASPQTGGMVSSIGMDKPCGPDERCFHPTAPRMSLVLIASACPISAAVDTMPSYNMEPTFGSCPTKVQVVRAGRTFRLEKDWHLYLAPNDTPNAGGLNDNSGAIDVQVSVLGPDSHVVARNDAVCTLDLVATNQFRVGQERAALKEDEVQFHVRCDELEWGPGNAAEAMIQFELAGERVA
jgi:hypothetical protein